MARKGLIESNERKKKLTRKMHNRRRALKRKLMNREASLEERFEASLKLAAMPRNASPTRIRMRCMETGRPRGYYGFCGLSRIALREEAVRGRMPGVTRSSW